MVGLLLLKKILENQHNDFMDNYDPNRFGTLKAPSKVPLRSRIKKVLNKAGFVKVQAVNKGVLARLDSIEPYIDRLNDLYNLLSDRISKQWVVDLSAFRLMGRTKIKLPVNTDTYWTQIRRISESRSSEVLETGFRGFVLEKYDLSTLGYPLKIWFSAAGVMITYVLKQYQYNHEGVFVGARPGDYVIDAGGCWGDTALFFAHEVGETGKVFSFEFIESNIAFFKKNTGLNPELEQRIHIVSRPLWDRSDTDVYYSDDGPASHVSFDEQEGGGLRTTTVAIDDMVKSKDIPKVDFIKMDIEGAELAALKGAKNTLEKYRPDLAISVYHSLDDMVDIPEYLNSLDLGYRFYLDHFTIHLEETVLFATTK